MENKTITLEQIANKIYSEKRVKEVILDGSADVILVPTETGKYEVWKKISDESSKFIEGHVTTKIGEYVVPGNYKFDGYKSIRID